MKITVYLFIDSSEIRQFFYRKDQRTDIHTRINTGNPVTITKKKEKAVNSLLENLRIRFGENTSNGVFLNVQSLTVYQWHAIAG